MREINTLSVIQAWQSLENGNPQEAVDMLAPELDKNPENGVLLYSMGFAYRMLNEFSRAEKYYLKALDSNVEDTAPIPNFKGDSNFRPLPDVIYCHLGIVYQLQEKYAKAIGALEKAIEINPDYEIAYNSLALTQKKCCDFDKALQNYDAGVKALARRIAKTLRNDRTSPIFKHREIKGTLWVEYVINAALSLACSVEGIDRISWPTGEQALEEERTEQHAGLYWIDMQSTMNETVRMFLPNYLSTFQELLIRESAYSTIIGNRGTLLELLDRQDEARQHFNEAAEFLRLAYKDSKNSNG